MRKQTRYLCSLPIYYLLSEKNIHWCFYQKTMSPKSVKHCTKNWINDWLKLNIRLKINHIDFEIVLPDENCPLLGAKECKFYTRELYFFAHRVDLSCRDMPCREDTFIRFSLKLEKKVFKANPSFGTLLPFNWVCQFHEKVVRKSLNRKRGVRGEAVGAISLKHVLSLSFVVQLEKRSLHMTQRVCS